MDQIRVNLPQKVVTQKGPMKSQKALRPEQSVYFIHKNDFLLGGKIVSLSGNKVKILVPNSGFHGVRVSSPSKIGTFEGIQPKGNIFTVHRKKVFGKMPQRRFRK